ncbi:MAG TPA: M28 family peptidase, partial [Miltoncostaeaceae bacterium]|nr:M28 family peptidase [Miltoncostaeaceae bacterium]
MTLLLLALAAAVGGGCASAGGGADAVPAVRADPDGFDGARAMALLRAQVRVGPRPAGSPQLRHLAVRLRALLPHGRFEPVPGAPGGMRNIVGRLPGRAPALLVGAHYDTKALPGFVGANDAAAGTAAVIELARVLARDRRACAREIRFVLFDGEESPSDERPFSTSGLRGSRHHAARHARGLGAAVLPDFIAGKGVRLPREAGSDARLWHRLRVAADRVGGGAIF